MNSNKKLLMRELKWTIIGLGIAMLALWILFYFYMQQVFRNYVVDNMEQVSTSTLLELNQSFLGLEEVAFTLSDNAEVTEFLKMEGGADFYTKASSVSRLMNLSSPDNIFMDNMILYNPAQRYYRFFGNISSTGIRRMIDVIEGSGDIKYIRISLDEKNYIAYVGTIVQKGTPIGKVVMLTDEADVHRLFDRLTENENMRIALAAEGKIILSSDKEMLDADIGRVAKDREYTMRKQVGFTPFELLVAYEDSDNRLDFLFLTAVAAMALVLFFLFQFFLDMWKKKFFIPIQGVISEVEGFQEKKENIISFTGMEHFDGLVRGINDMVIRIKQQEKEVYETAYQLQEAEIEKQKALIVSLKKQISAHFTVNVLSSISALSAEGENEKATLLCDGLSHLLRYANAGDSFIGGMDEFFVLQKYADIMSVRYPNRFIADIDMVDDLEEIELPRMLLQPIVENCIIHGFSDLPEGQKGNIRIYFRHDKDIAEFVIEDDGKGMGKEQLSNLLEQIRDPKEEVYLSEGLSHVALKNIERRIRSYYGEGYGLRMESEPGKGTTVTVTLPAGK